MKNSKSGNSQNKTTGSAKGNKKDVKQAGQSAFGNGSSGKTYSSTDENSLNRPHGEQAFTSLLEEGLKDLYWVEKTLVKSIPKMIKQAESQELIETLEDHLQVTKEQVRRVEQIFKLMGKTAQAKKCAAMQGILDESEEMMRNHEGIIRDAAIIASAQKVEHYEIASYGTLCAYANILGLYQVEQLLCDTLDEEKEADDNLSDVAESTVNPEAMMVGEGRESYSQRRSYGPYSSGNSSDRRGNRYGGFGSYGDGEGYSGTYGREQTQHNYGRSSGQYGNSQTGNRGGAYSGYGEGQESRQPGYSQRSGRESTNGGRSGRSEENSYGDPRWRNRYESGMSQGRSSEDESRSNDRRHNDDYETDSRNGKSNGRSDKRHNR